MQARIQPFAPQTAYTVGNHDDGLALGKDGEGVSAFRYLIFALVCDIIKKTAKAPLSTSLYFVGEVAVRCGFDSISYFSEELRKAYGEPPSRIASKPFWYEMF